jgi:uncharacterized protein YbbC (DUF1343 family)
MRQGAEKCPRFICRIIILIPPLITACLLLFPLNLSACQVKTGAQILHESSYEILSGKKVGLITNQTGQINGSHLIDSMNASGKVFLQSIFAPEHGLRGDAEDGKAISSGVDPKTGIKIHSLYGNTKKPTKDMLRNLDALVFDIQDVGARFYTFISTMGLAMQAAAEAGIPFYVLDRPNPLGGEYVSGFVMQPAHFSFTGRYPIPVAHGMTTGELAKMIVGEQFLPGLGKTELHIVRMEGWKRSMQWPDTGLPWIPTSPNIPSFETALAYAGTGLLEPTSASEGRGTQEPFMLAGMPEASASVMISEISRQAPPGAAIHLENFIPVTIPGVSSSPKYRNRQVSGMRLEITDRCRFQPVETGIAIMSAVYKSISIKERKGFFSRGFAQMSGSEQLKDSIIEGKSSADIASLWKDEISRFITRRKAYLLYQD